MNRRAYGYELRDRLHEVFSDVLDLSQSAIYQALRSLEQQGLVVVVESGERTRHRRRDSRVYYEITEQGRLRYHAWLKQAPKKGALREDVLLHLMAAELEDIPALIEGLTEFENQCRLRLRTAMALPLGTSSARTARGQSFGAALAHDALVAHLQTNMEWAQRSRATLQRELERRTGVSGRRRP